MSTSDASERGRDAQIDAPMAGRWDEARYRPRAREGVGPATASVMSLLAAIAGAGMGAVAARSAAFDSVLPPMAAPAPVIDPALAQRIAVVEERWRAAEALVGGSDPAALLQRISELNASVQALRGRIGEADLAALSAQVARLQAQTDTIRAQSAEASLAARSAFAVAAATEAARSSQPFEPALATLEAVLPGNSDVAALAPYAKTGAPSRQELKDEFAGQDDAIIRAARVTAAGAGFWGRVSAFFAQFVTVRKEGGGDLPVDMVERARARLAADDLAGAVAELARLTGPAAAAARPWLERAKARLEIDARLAAIRQELSRGGA